MGAEGGGETETLPAVRALVGFLPRMDALMFVEGRPNSEPLPALVAGEGLFAGVDPLVGDEEGPPTEDLPAVGTAIETLLHGPFCRPGTVLPVLGAAVGLLRPAATRQPSALSR